MAFQTLYLPHPPQEKWVTGVYASAAAYKLQNTQPHHFFLLIMSAGVWERTQRVVGVLYFFNENIFNFFWQFNIQNNPQPLLLRSWESCILVAISLVFLQHKEWLLESLGERKRINPLFTSWSMVTTLQQHLVQLVLNSYRLGGGENQGKLKYRMSKKTVPGSAEKRNWFLFQTAKRMKFSTPLP